MADDPSMHEARMQAHPNITVTFGHLRDVCMAKGWAVRMNIFDCGHYVEVQDIQSGKTITNATWRCHDGEGVPDGATQCARWLVEHEWLRLADFDNDVRAWR